MDVKDGWVEIGDRVFVRRYEFYDQNIGLILGRAEALVIDTRSTYAQAREIQEHVRELTDSPIGVVVDTHGHFDHAFGNHVFRPATIWGHDRCVAFIERTGEVRRARVASEMRDSASRSRSRYTRIRGASIASCRFRPNSRKLSIICGWVCRIP